MIPNQEASLQWYVARTRPRAEHAARACLEAKGIDCFLPCVNRPHPQPGYHNVPLFPGYLFLRWDMWEQGPHPVREVPQLVGLVTFEGVAPLVPGDVISELRHRVEAINRDGGLWTRFQVGERVHVRLGPAESLAEVVVGAESPREHVRVLLEFLGRQVHAKVPWQDVWLVKDHDLVWDREARPPRRTRGRGRWIKGYGSRTEEYQLQENNVRSSL